MIANTFVSNMSKTGFISNLSTVWEAVIRKPAVREESHCFHEDRTDDTGLFNAISQVCVCKLILEDISLFTRHESCKNKTLLLSNVSHKHPVSSQWNHYISCVLNNHILYMCKTVTCPQFPHVRRSHMSMSPSLDPCLLNIRELQTSLSE